MAWPRCVHNYASQIQRFSGTSWEPCVQGVPLYLYRGVLTTIRLENHYEGALIFSPKHKIFQLQNETFIAGEFSCQRLKYHYMGTHITSMSVHIILNMGPHSQRNQPSHCCWSSQILRNRLVPYNGQNHSFSTDDISPLDMATLLRLVAQPVIAPSFLPFAVVVWSIIFQPSTLPKVQKWGGGRKILEGSRKWAEGLAAVGCAICWGQGTQAR